VLHKPAPISSNDPTIAYKKRTGAWMFLLYALVYAGFVGINVVNPLAMETPVVGGLNLAVTYGFGLIVLALVMALIYNRLCGDRERASRVDDTAERVG
jgi:uncharacterized membrane protein (DUF485 family)